MRTTLHRMLGCLAMVLLCHQDASALSFRIVPDDGFGSRVLVVYDCGRLVETVNCTASLSHFDSDDPARLRHQWSMGPFEEVWLLSGGGAVDAGIAIANDLRAHSQTVRVPSSGRLLKAGLQPGRPPACVSSCTIAFMGGQFRAIDEGATYQVHAASYVAWGDVEASLPAIRQVLQIVKERGLGALLRRFTNDTRHTARELFSVFQDTLWLPIKGKAGGSGDVERQRREQAFNEWEREKQGQSPRYPATQQSRDEAVLALEGDAALQDIVMRVERAEMDQAIAEIGELSPRLGRRADAALAMLASMFDTSSILETNSMPGETLVKMGYVTEFVK